MEKFKREFLEHKTVSVWGTGYLGYTEVIRLQSEGCRVNLYDITETGFKEKIKKNAYPDKEQISSWSERGEIHPIELSRINAIDDIEAMVASKVHILAFPVADREGNNLLKKMADILLSHRKKMEGSLVILLSAGIPGTIDKGFVEVLRRGGLECGFVSAFRSDWTVEEFLSGNKTRVLAANDPLSQKMGEYFFEMLGISHQTLSSIKEAEIYENAKNGLQYASEVFVNQLAMAYPGTDIRRMTRYLLNDLELNESHLSIGAGGYKMPHSVRNIIEGSTDPNILSLIREVQNANISMILSYAEIARKLGAGSATIMGISVKGYLKNIDLSPSVLLGEYLNKLGVQVYIDDPFYDSKFLSEILPFAKRWDIFKNGFKSDALFVMTDHNQYKYITQKEINALGIDKATLIIDNVGLFKEFKFSQHTNYHAIGDGKLGLV